MHDIDLYQPPENVAHPATYHQFNGIDDLQPGLLNYDISPSLFESWQETLVTWFWSGYGEQGSKEAFYSVLLNKLDRQWKQKLAGLILSSNSILLTG